MLLDDKLDIKISNSNVKYYKDKGFKCESGDSIIINISDLPNGSHIKVKCKCDICELEKTLTYRKYLKNINNGGYYACSRKCSENKIINTSLKLYGVEWASQSNWFKKSVIETCEKLYNVSNVSKIETVKQKKVDTSKERYGTEHHMMLKYFQVKKCETCRYKYGFDFPLQNEDIYNKYLKTSFKINTYKNTHLTYQASYELDFLNRYFKLLNIKNAPKIKYYLDDKDRYYYPDFYLPDYNLIVEIKSSWTYEKDLIKNLTKKQYSINNGFNFIFIINKDYKEFENSYISCGCLT